MSVSILHLTLNVLKITFLGVQSSNILPYISNVVMTATTLLNM